jgi:hypothetical protein
MTSAINLNEYQQVAVSESVAAVEVLNEQDPRAKPKLISSILCGSIITTVVLIIFSAFHVLQIFVGVINIEKCPIQSMIPIWLIVMGVGSLILSFIRIIFNVIVLVKKCKSLEAERKRSLLNWFICFSTLFLFVWFIFGNLLVYSKWNKVKYDINDLTNNYCDKLTYLIAFWSLNIPFIIFIAFIGVCRCLVFTIICAKASNQK